MNPASLRAVVDASVAVKIFAPEALSAQVQAMFARFSQDSDAELIVPDFFFIECANPFGSGQRSQNGIAQQAGRSLRPW